MRRHFRKLVSELSAESSIDDVLTLFPGQPGEDSDFTLKGQPGGDSDFTLEGQPGGDTDFTLARQPGGVTDFTLVGQPGWVTDFTLAGQPGTVTDFTLVGQPVGDNTECLVPRMWTKSMSNPYASDRLCKRSLGSWKLKKSRKRFFGCRLAVGYSGFRTSDPLCCQSLQIPSVVSPFRSPLLSIRSDPLCCQSLQIPSVVNPFRSPLLSIPSYPLCCQSLHTILSCVPLPWQRQFRVMRYGCYCCPV